MIELKVNGSATTVAERGSLEISAISPTSSPAATRAIRRMPIPESRKTPSRPATSM